MRRKIAAGNWKMNGNRAALDELEALNAVLPDTRSSVVICPPAYLLYPACKITEDMPIAIGAQDCHSAPKGAHTGDISAPMIADTDAAYIIVGHSERREDHDESDATILAKAQATQTAGLTAIICIGESLQEREANNTLNIIKAQLAGSVPDTISADNTVIAYEPIWAIGTGKVPTLDQIIEVHDFIRADLTARFGADTANAIPLLYGGSVKADNAATIFTAENVDGALVGGASLKASDFAPIVTALDQSE